MVSNDANYLKMTEITGGGQPTNQTDSTPTALVVGRLVGVEEKDSVFPSIRLRTLGEDQRVRDPLEFRSRSGKRSCGD